MVYEFFEWDKISTALLAGRREERGLISKCPQFINRTTIKSTKNKSKCKKITEKKQISLPHPLNSTGLSIEDLRSIWPMEHLL